MTLQIRFALLAGASLSFLGSAAIAQETSSVARAEPSAGEIVVTAQRRSERLQEVPISVTSVSGDQMEKLDLKTIDSIAMVTPGLTFNKDFTFAQNYIRGIGTNYPQPGLESAVATYVDGAYVPRALGSIFDLLDMQSVQVLKGPQGTLYGRNASGGAILVQTQDPIDAVEMKFASEYGRFDHVLGEGVVNLPINDTMAIRVAARGISEDGYIQNIADGERFGERKGYQVRTKFKWSPTDAFSAVLGIQHNRMKDGAGGKAQRFGPPVCLGCALPGSGESPVTDFYKTDLDVTSPFISQSTSANLRMTYDTDTVSIESTTAYRKQTFHGTIDQDYTRLPLFTYHSTNSDGKTFSQDLTLTSKLDGPLNGMIGGSYMHDDAVQAAFIDGAFFQPLIDLFGMAPGVRNGYLTKSYSAFGEIYYTPIDRLKITLGGRYTHDSRRVTGDLNTAGVAGFTPPGSPSSYVDSTSFNSFTPRAVIAYDTGPVNLYGSYNKGFKAGGYTSPSFTQPPVIDPEKVESFEAGAKFVSEDGRLRANIAAFTYKAKNLQVSVTDTATGGQAIQNAAGARGKGFEVDGSYAPTSWFNLSAGGSYLRARYRDFSAASVQILTPTGLVAGAEDLSGTRLQRAPKFTAYVSANLEGPVTQGWVGRLSAVATYSSDYDFFPGAGGTLRYDRQSDYTIMNLTGGIGPENKRYEIGFYVNNLTDKKYVFTRQTTAPFGTGEYVAPPRTYGLRVSAQF